MIKIMVRTLPFKFLIFIIFSLLFSKESIAKDNIRFSVGVNYYKINDNDPRFKYVNSYDEKPFQQFKTISTGILFKPIPDSNLVIGGYTNRLINNPTVRKTIDTKYNILVDTQTKTISDTVMIGYSLHYIMPGVFVSRVDSKKTIFYNSRSLGTSKVVSPVIGATIAVFVNKHAAINFMYVKKNKDLSIADSLGIGASLIF